jgi:hypothetical protein
LGTPGAIGARAASLTHKEINRQGERERKRFLESFDNSDVPLINSFSRVSAIVEMWMLSFLF